MDTQLRLVRAKRFGEKLKKGLPVYANLEDDTRHRIIHIDKHSAETIHGITIPLVSIVNFD